MRTRLFFIGVLFLAGCASHISTTSTQTGKYSEDLSVVRPKAEVQHDESVVQQQTNERKQTAYVEPTHAINKQLDEVLDSISSLNLSQKYVDGYTIQVYSGTKREDALNVKKQLVISFPEMESDIQFQQPNFRVKVGRYLQQLDAQRDYMALRKAFPNAILIPDKISIN
jgi:hypothetical protein